RSSKAPRPPASWLLQGTAPSAACGPASTTRCRWWVWRRWCSTWRSSSGRGDRGGAIGDSRRAASVGQSGSDHYPLSSITSDYPPSPIPYPLSMSFKILTLNNISVRGLERLPRDLYEVASEIGHPD